jgi:hypothetical protein
MPGGRELHDCIPWADEGKRMLYNRGRDKRGYPIDADEYRILADPHG